jgi:Protein of unknown function (DUF2637)
MNSPKLGTMLRLLRVPQRSTRAAVAPPAPQPEHVAKVARTKPVRRHELGWSIWTARRAALIGIAVFVTVATCVAFVESYDGLFQWARTRGLTGDWARAWPLQVDAFILIGELTLFVGTVDHWSRWKMAGAWSVTLGGLAVSVAGNIGHADVAGMSTTMARQVQATAAVPPLAATIGLMIGLQVLKAVISAMVTRDEVPETAPEPAPAPEPVRPVPARGAVFLAPSTARLYGTDGTVLAPEPVSQPEPVRTAPAPESASPERSAQESPAEPRTGTVPAPRSAPGKGYGAGPGHPKWNDGVALYRASLQGPGRRMSQRDLAAALDMRNRALAANIIRYVNDEITSREERVNGAREHGLSQATGSAQPA